MVKKVLPPLNEQNQVPNIAGSGEWKAEDATFLEKLAKGLKMYSSRNEIAPKKTSKRKDELDTAYAAKCPQCSSKMIFTEGCKKCSSCSYSAC